MIWPLTLCLAAALTANPLPSGDHERHLGVDDRVRTYFVHVPPQLDLSRPIPVVLVFHGAGMNGRMMAHFTGLNDKANAAGFVAVYPNGTGAGELLLVFNAAGTREKPFGSRADDVKFVGSLLDDLATVLPVDPDRVFATGFSNGGMLCYRLAAELPERIAAIAPVAGTQAIRELVPRLPVPILHLHGTQDLIVPWDGPKPGGRRSFPFLSLDDTLAIWRPVNRCVSEAVQTDVPDAVADETRVIRRQYLPESGGAAIDVYVIEGGGHNWPGSTRAEFAFLGKSTGDIAANDLIWDFFVQHPRSARAR